MITATMGGAALLAALALAGFGAGTSAWAGLREDAVLARVGRRALYAAAGTVALAAAALEWALLDHQFELAYVTEHTDRSLPWPLLASSFYGGQEGSLLYWTLVLVVLGSVAVAVAGRSGVRLQAYATAILAGLAAFFVGVLVFAASPFDLLEVTPADGLGLNPVLRDGGMLIHPPFLLAGFSSFAIPFAFAMASLLAGRLDAGWLAQTRRVALVAWSLQTVGLTLGMWWAYHVLGWGGYWGWDPVENVALLPWLATTAYIHSAQVQERRGQLKAWNLGLVVAAFLLAIFGTFLVRSGALVSVHTFAASDVGPWFFGLLAVLVAFSLGVLAWRSGSLRSDRAIDSAVSREGAFLLQNFLLIGLVAAVLWGTLLPLLSGLFGAQRVVGPSYYERVSGPLFLAILLLLAAGPLLPWRRLGRGWWRMLAWPLVAAVAALAVLGAAGVRGVPLLVFVVLAGAAATSVRGFRPLPLAWRHRRVYGAYLAHLGVVVVAAGIVGSHFWQSERTVTLAPGDSVTVAGHTLMFSGFSERDGTVREQFVALSMGEETLQPARAFYPGTGGQAVTRVAISSTALEDVYVVLNDAAADHATVTVFVNPLVTWIWAGAAILVLGILLGNLGTVAPAAAPVRARAPVPAT